ncbi:TlpA family protein disulfide reductase [Streptomyces coffeae]|uniref:Thioredoxin family protein n=1 Tax=Streptomyces coffeae TaxID=621382 RepID=A0ABS1N9Y5_9ACTN|nr:thioredoxin family protein [Streptomyces coffeae]
MLPDVGFWGYRAARPCREILITSGIFVAAGTLYEGRPTGGRRTGEGRTARVRDADRSGRLSAAELGGELGRRATLVQFSSAFCQPCRATRRTLDEVAAMVDGVVHLEIDAEAHLELVRALDVVRTPTVLVLDASGRIVRRASGQPRRADVIAALGDAV